MTMLYSMGGKVLDMVHSWPGMIFLCVFFVAVLIYCFRQTSTQQKIKRWQKSLNLPQHKIIFQRVYDHVDGFKLSKQARQKQDAIEYTYGEIEFLPFIALLSLVKPDRETVFYDLGCGIGKAVLACAMVFPIRKSVGIEILPELYRTACNQAQQLALNQHYTEQTNKIVFILGNFLEVDLNEATLIFINSTTIIGTVWDNICLRLNNLPELNTIITTSKAIICDNFYIVNRTKIEMSWGVVDAYIHTRKTNFY